jgi:hypothetical protein
MICEVLMGLIADMLKDLFKFDTTHDINERVSATQSSVYDRLSAMDRVFYAYDEDNDQVPFSLGSDNDDVGYYNDINDDDEIKNYDDEFITISPSFCHSVNIDGTPFLGCSQVDIYGNPYGVTSTDMFEDTSSDMFEDDGMGCDMFSDDTY